MNVTKETYGALYNWYAATYNVGGASIAPVGWHVPDDAEWNTLVTFLGGGLIAGGKLKEVGFAYWQPPNTGANNSSGFTALPGGMRELTGTIPPASYNGINLTGYWMSSSVYAVGGHNENGFFGIAYDGADGGIWGTVLLSCGLSIRLIKDDSINPGNVIDVDGNSYHTVKIGTQVWMAENLKVEHYNNGIIIPNITDDALWAADTAGAMSYYGNDIDREVIIPYNYGNLPVYRFYMSYHTFTYEVFPLNFLSTTLVDELEENQIFYRRKFNGNLLFGSDSRVKDVLGITQNRMDDWILFWLIEQIEPGGRIDFLITRTVETSTTVYWDGYFSISAGKFDLDKCTYEVKPSEDDDYTVILDKAEIQYNILITPTVVTTRATRGLIDHTYTRNRWLMDAINYIVDQILGVTTTVVSHFFTDPVNYVTGVTNYLTLLTIAQKSDIIRPLSTDPATKAMISWNELMKILWVMFQVKWDYDYISNTINVEHISKWGAVAGLDLTTQLMAKATNKYSYLTVEMPKYEKFHFMEQDAVNFVGVPIRYVASCVNQDPKTNIVDNIINVTTDLEYIHNVPEAIADDGFVILCNYVYLGLYYVEYKSGVYNSDIKLNARLGWGDLHNDWYRYERVWIQGYLNENLTDFITARKSKLQQCSAIVCSSGPYGATLLGYDPKDYITTELGEKYFDSAKGYVKKSELKPTGEISFDLVYGLAPNAVPPPPVEETCILVVGYLQILAFEDYRLWFYFNKPVPADITIRVREIVYNDVGVKQCTGGWETVTFSMGDISEMFEDTLCDFLENGWCVVIEIEYDDDEICHMDIDPDPLYSCTNPAPFIYTIL
jgi:uncharacterized protein (TIGR02145 family)